MKKRVISLFVAIIVFFSIVAFLPANGQSVSVKFNSSGLVPGSTIHVPIVMTGSAIASFQLILNYDRTVLTYQSTDPTTYLNGLPHITLGITANYTNANLPGGVSVPYYKLSYTASCPGSDYPADQVIATLNFTYNGGATDFSFTKISTLTTQTQAYYTFIATCPGVSGGTINLATSFTNQSIGILHSQAIGGTWKTRSCWLENVKPSSGCDVFITGSAVVIDSVAVCHNLQINTVGKLTLNTSTILNINGSFAIKSDATGTGSFVDLGTTSIQGGKTVERYLTGGALTPIGSRVWHDVIPPVGGATANTFLGGLLNRYDEPTQTWVGIVPTTTAIPATEGYEVAMPAAGTITYTGTSLNTGDYTFSGLTKTSLVPVNYAGFHLVGNIYPSALAYNTTWTKSNLYSTIYVWDPTAGSYAQHNGTIGTGNMADGILPAGQGFFVANSAAVGVNASITVPNALRQHSAKAFVKEAVPELVRLRVSGNSYFDEMVVNFNSNATVGFDVNFDGYKMAGATAAPMLYSILPGNIDASINVLPSRQECLQVPLGFVAGANGTYTINASDLGSFPSGTPVQLEDIFTGNVIDLNTTPEYSFDAAVGSPEHRFNLWFSPLAVTETIGSNVAIYSSDNVVYVNIPFTSQGRIIVYNILGNEIANQGIQSNSLNKITMSVPAGYYIVKVVDNDHSISRKVFIN